MSNSNLFWMIFWIVVILTIGALINNLTSFDADFMIGFGVAQIWLWFRDRVKYLTALNETVALAEQLKGHLDESEANVKKLKDIVQSMLNDIRNYIATGNKSILMNMIHNVMEKAKA